MHFLVAALLCSASVSLALKATDRLEYDRYGMFTMNYIACLVPFLISRIGKDMPQFGASFSGCVLFAAANGFLYLAGLAMNQANVKRNGAILQSTFARLGVMVPTCLSIVFFGERPSLLQAIGLLMTAVAFCIMGFPRKGSGKKDMKSPSFTLLMLALLLGGLADSMLKVFEEYGDPALNDWFMGLTFIFAALLSLIMTAVHHGHIGKKEVAIGLGLGIPNYLSSLLLLHSLSSVSAYIAYPTYSIGAILTVMAVSTAVFRERITGWSRISFALLIPAILLLNL